MRVSIVVVIVVSLPCQNRRVQHSGYRTLTSSPRTVRDRRLLDNAVKFEPYLGDLIQYEQLVKDIEKDAGALEMRVNQTDNGTQSLRERIAAYQGVANDVPLNVARFEKQIEAAQGKVAMQRKAHYDVLLLTHQDKKSWLGNLAARRDGRKILDDMLAAVAGRAQIDQEKKFVKLTCYEYVEAEEKKVLPTLLKEQAYYVINYSYSLARADSAKLRELKEYARQEHGLENILFLEAVAAKADTSYIYNDFIIENSPHYINLPANLDQDVKNAKMRLKINRRLVGSSRMRCGPRCLWRLTVLKSS
jgi:hypothetical protein